uniref:Mitochondrial import inner membrane translocase subunit TIM50 n=1 Tax=Alexandrium catenella TaxID=2925 RepID=A0A7S1KWH9_ALECA
MWRGVQPLQRVATPCRLGARRRQLSSGGGGGLPPYLLALDLDETLVRPKIHGVPEHRARTLKSVDFEVSLPVGEGVPCQISLRPGLAAFFDWMRKRRAEGTLEGPWLFAQGAPVYVKPVLKRLDPSGDIFGDRLLTKEHCTVPKTPGYVLKNLTSLVKGDNSGAGVGRVILVDNNAVSAILHPTNTLMVRDWRGDRPQDNELERVSSVLDELTAAMREGAEGVVPGDYASLMSSRTPGYSVFCQEMRGLHSLLDSDLSAGEPLKQRLRHAWGIACRSKEELLGLGPGEH